MEDFFKFIDSSFIIAVLSVFSVGQILNTFIKYLLDRRPMVSEIDKKMFMIYSEIYYAVIENPISKVKNHLQDFPAKKLENRDRQKRPLIP